MSSPVPPVNGINNLATSPPRAEASLMDSPPGSPTGGRSTPPSASRSSAKRRRSSVNAPMSPVAFDTAISHLSLKEQMEIEQREQRKQQLSARASPELRTTNDPSSISKRRSLPSITIETEKSNAPSNHRKSAQRRPGDPSGKSVSLQDDQQIKINSTNPDLIASEQLKIRYSYRHVREQINQKYRSAFTRDRYREFRRTFKVFDRDEDGILHSNDLSSFLQWGEQKTVDITRMMKALYGADRMTFPQFIDLMFENEHIFVEFLNGTRSLKSIEKLSMAMYGGMKSKRKRRRNRYYPGRKHGLVMTREDMQVIKKIRKKKKQKEVVNRKREVRREVMDRLIPQNPLQHSPGKNEYTDQSFNRTSTSPSKRPYTSNTLTGGRGRRTINKVRPGTTPSGIRQRPSVNQSRKLSPSHSEFTYAPQLYSSPSSQKHTSPNHIERGHITPKNPFSVPIQETRLHSVFAPGGSSLLNSRNKQVSPINFRYSHRSPTNSNASPSRRKTRLSQLSRQSSSARVQQQQSAEAASTPTEMEESSGFNTERRRKFYAKLRKNNPYAHAQQQQTPESPNSSQVSPNCRRSVTGDLEQNRNPMEPLPPRRASRSAPSSRPVRRSSLTVQNSERSSNQTGRKDLTPTPELSQKPIMKSLDSVRMT